MKSVRRVVEAGKPGSSSRRTAWFFFFLFACLVGCGVRQRAAPLDEELASASLKTVLDGWKKGDAPDSLKNGVPSIIAQDPDWVTGARLLAYEVADDRKRVAENLFVSVKLTLRTKTGKPTSKLVTYVIGTSPHIMVFRSPR